MGIKLSAFFFALLFLPVVMAGCNTSGSTPPPSSNGNNGSSCIGASGVSGKPALSNDSSKPTVLASDTVGGEIPDGAPPLFASHNTTISGTVTYEDKPFDKNGFTGLTPAIPVRQAKVEVVDNEGGTVVKTAVTDKTGRYSITFNVSLTSGSVYVRAFTDTVSTSTFAATVMDNETCNAVYAVSSNPATISPGDSATVNLVAGENGAGPAFNIFDMMITAQESVQSLASTPPPQVNAYWYAGGNEGTYYWPKKGAHRIFLLGAPSSGTFKGDSDAYDDTVILHEMGHYVAAAYSRDDSPGGQHTLTGHYDLRLTWSEGWSTYFGSMVKEMAGESNPEFYVDTNDNGALSFEIETPDPNSKGADNELAIAAVLWDIDDPFNPFNVNESFDNLSGRIADTWSIFENRLPSARVATFETFWDAWETDISPGQLTPFLTDRDIRYNKDLYEVDDTTSSARILSIELDGISEKHTFFPEGDKDYWKINVKSGITYAFKTEALGDGADTVLTLYDAGGATRLARNDDDPGRENDPEVMQQLASLIEFTAKSNTTVYLMAEPYRPASTGDPDAVSRYGYYTLTIAYYTLATAQ